MPDGEAVRLQLSGRMGARKKPHNCRHPLEKPSVWAPDHKDIIIRQVTEVIEDEALEEMSKVAAADKDYQKVVTTIHSGSYERKKIKNLHKSHPA